MDSEAYEKALLDPSGTFGEPEAVVRHTDLTRGQKIAILERWQHDAEEIAVAQQEGMSGGDTTHARAVARALETVQNG